MTEAWSLSGHEKTIAVLIGKDLKYMREVAGSPPNLYDNKW